MKTFTQVARALSTFVAPLYLSRLAVDEQRGRQSPSRGSGATESSVAGHQVALAIALALTFTAYCGTEVFQFVFDDRELIVENSILRSWSYLPRYFSHDLWAFRDPNAGNYYRPVFLLWLRAERALFELGPAGWHLTNVVLHLLVTLLVYALASKLVGDRLTGALAAAIFGVHPVHVESVAWASGVIDPLMSALFIASFLCYLRKRESKGQGRVWAAASLFLYGVALLAKEPAIVLPLLILAYEWIFWPETSLAAGDSPSGKRTRKAIRSAAPYLALTALYLTVRVIVLKGFSHPPTRLGWSTTIYTGPPLLLFYLRLLLWPVGLSICYDLPYVTRAASWEFVLPLLGLALVGGLVWAWARRAAMRDNPETSRKISPALAFACAWLILPILPALDLSDLPASDFAHDRYLYLPSVGFAILVAVALGLGEKASLQAWRRKAIRIGFSSALVLALVALTIRQSLFWATDMKLFTRAVSHAPNNLYYKTSLANLLVERGMEREAMGLYQEVLSRSPDYWWANLSQGYAYYHFGKLDQARQRLTRAIALNPSNPKQFLFLGLTEIGAGRLEEATAALRQALRLQPYGLAIHFGLGMVLQLQGDLQGAAKEFKAELEVNPGEPAAMKRLAEIEGGGRGSSRPGPPAEGQTGRR